jgi:DNA-directed RNA polymerase subunit RPC12/RpoP
MSSIIIDDDKHQDEKVVYRCSSCGHELPLQVLKSAAGFYIGTACNECGPNSRESERYWRKRELAQAALDTGKWVPCI